MRDRRAMVIRVPSGRFGSHHGFASLDDVHAIPALALPYDFLPRAIVLHVQPPNEVIESGERHKMEHRDLPQEDPNSQNVLEVAKPGQS